MPSLEIPEEIMDDVRLAEVVRARWGFVHASGPYVCKCLVERSKREISHITDPEKATKCVCKYRELIKEALDRHTMCHPKRK